MIKMRESEVNLPGSSVANAIQEGPKIELVTDQVSNTRSFRLPCPPYLCLPNNPPVKDTGQR